MAFLIGDVYSSISLYSFSFFTLAFLITMSDLLAGDSDFDKNWAATGLVFDFLPVELFDEMGTFCYCLTTID